MGFPAAESISIYDQYGIDGERESSLYVELWKSPCQPRRTVISWHMQTETLIKILQAREDAKR